jgi:hypothetical protein
MWSERKCLRFSEENPIPYDSISFIGKGLETSSEEVLWESR